MILNPVLNLVQGDPLGLFTKPSIMMGLTIAIGVDGQIAQSRD